MKKPLEQMYEYLENEEETTVLELLDITSPELVSAYKHKVRSRHDYISKYYEESFETEEKEPHHHYQERSPDRGLGSKQVWENAGFEQDNEDY